MRRAKHCAVPENASGQRDANRLRRKEFDPPFPFPLRGKAGAGGFPPRREHAARQPKALARIDAVGSPHKRAAAPCVSPAQTPRRGRREQDFVL
jgi:hypothetical protein